MKNEKALLEQVLAVQSKSPALIARMRQTWGLA